MSRRARDTDALTVFAETSEFAGCAGEQKPGASQHKRSRLRGLLDGGTRNVRQKLLVSIRGCVTGVTNLSEDIPLRVIRSYITGNRLVIVAGRGGNPRLIVIVRRL